MTRRDSRAGVGAGRRAYAAARLIARAAALELAALPALAPAQNHTAAAPTPAPGSARALMEEGRRRYGAGDFAGAAARFDEAAQRAGGRLDPARAHFNAAAAFQRLGQLDAAEERLQQALRTNDRETQAKAWYNLGHAAMTRAEQQAAAGDPAGARAPMNRALEAYRNAIRLAPDDLEAKINFEWVQRRLKELEEEARRQQQQQQQQPDTRQQPQDRQDQQPEPSPGESGEEQQNPQKPPAGNEQNSEQQAGAHDQPDQPDQPDSASTSADAQRGREREMTAEDAARLLDALREEEDALRRNLRLRLGEPVPVEKDW